MEFLITVASGVGAFIGAVLAHFIAHDAYTQSPRYARHLIRLAAQRLPERVRQRYDEEWLAALDEHQGVFAKFRHAVGCVLAVPKLRAACRRKLVLIVDGVVTARLNETGAVFFFQSLKWAIKYLRSLKSRNVSFEEDSMKVNFVEQATTFCQQFYAEHGQPTPRELRALTKTINLIDIRSLRSMKVEKGVQTTVVRLPRSPQATKGSH